MTNFRNKDEKISFVENSISSFSNIPLTDKRVANFRVGVIESLKGWVAEQVVNYLNTFPHIYSTINSTGRLFALLRMTNSILIPTPFGNFDALPFFFQQSCAEIYRIHSMYLALEEHRQKACEVAGIPMKKYDASDLDSINRFFGVIVSEEDMMYVYKMLYKSAQVWTDYGQAIKRNSEDQCRFLFLPSCVNSNSQATQR